MSRALSSSLVSLCRPADLNSFTVMRFRIETRGSCATATAPRAVRRRTNGIPIEYLSFFNYHILVLKVALSSRSTVDGGLSSAFI